MHETFKKYLHHKNSQTLIDEQENIFKAIYKAHKGTFFFGLENPFFFSIAKQKEQNKRNLEKTIRLIFEKNIPSWQSHMRPPDETIRNIWKGGGLMHEKNEETQARTHALMGVLQGW